MPKIVFVGDDGTERAVDAAVGESLMTVAVNNDIPGIDGECGGEMACGTCHIRVEEQWRDVVAEQGPDEADVIEVLVLGEVTPLSRLGCQVHVGKEWDGVQVTVPGE